MQRANGVNTSYAHEGELPSVDTLAGLFPSTTPSNDHLLFYKSAGSRVLAFPADLSSVPLSGQLYPLLVLSSPLILASLPFALLSYHTAAGFLSPSYLSLASEVLRPSLLLLHDFRSLLSTAAAACRCTPS